MRLTVQAGVCLTLLCGVVFVSRAAEEGQPEFTIKEVMKQAHKDGLLKKVVDGKGSPQDAEKLLALYKALAENKPPKGDEADWQQKTKAIVEAAQGVVDGKEGAAAALQKATNCAACHKAHKPS